MARPIKEGLDYFSLDSDFFENKKVRRIQRACSSTGIAVLINLLCNIYKDKGYYILWDEDASFDISDQMVGVKEAAIQEVVSKAVQVGFFDAEIYSAHRILTSHEIQERYKQGTARRNICYKKLDYWLLNVNNNPVNDGNMSTETQLLDTESTQIKEEESKVNKTKRKRVKKKNKKEREIEARSWARNQCSPSDEDLFEDFMNYWTESGEEEKDLRFEKEKTFNWKRRWSRWKRNEEKWNSAESDWKKKKVAPKKKPIDSGRHRHMYPEEVLKAYES